MSLERLKVLVPPPTKVCSPFDAEAWAKVEADLRIMFPTGYRELCFNYGSGHFVSDDTLDLTILNPCSPDYYRHIAVCNTLLWQLIAITPELAAFSVAPKDPGLFQWGNDDNGWVYLWLVDNGLWKIVVTHIRDGGVDILDLPIVSFLHSFLSGEFHNYAWGRQLVLAPEFSPYDG